MPGRRAQIAVMGAKGAVEIIFRNERGNHDAIAERTKEYEDRFLNPVHRGVTRLHRRRHPPALHPLAHRARATHAARTSRSPQIWKKHDNIPL